jgi:IPT/TIG domain
MGRFKTSVPNLVLLIVVLDCAGCGGGASSSVQIVTPPAPDFSLTVSSDSVSVSQGATSTAIVVGVTPQNGFSGSVQVTIGGLPSGVTSNPASPFSIAAGASTPVIIGAAANAQPGSYSISAQGTSGALTHSEPFMLAIQSAVAANLPRTTFARTDAISAFDDPFGEPVHRHLTYDSANKHLIVANRAMNRVEVFSTSTQTSVARIPVPGATSADLSSDGSSVWVGTGLETIVAIDTGTLQVKNRYPLAGLSPIPGTVFVLPTQVVSLASGKALVRLRQPISSEALLALWDPVANQLTNLTSVAPQLFQSGVGAMERSGDHSKVLVAAADSSAEIAQFDANGNLAAGPISLGSGIIQRVAANSDGSRFAAVFSSNGTLQILLLNAALAQVSAYTATNVHGVAFSRDNQSLYVTESLAGSPVLTVLSAQDGHVVGRVSDAAIQGVGSEIEDADETQLVFGLSNRGVSFLDAANPGALDGAAPSFSAAPAAQPAEGPAAGGTAVEIGGQNFSASPTLKFGSQLAANATLSGNTQIQVTSPPNVSQGAVNISTFFPNNWLAIAPDSFSYAPQVLRILPNAGVSTGGDTVQIYGYGFGADPTKITVTIGGSAATLQKAETLTAIAPSLALDNTYPFSLERLTFTTPPGNSGKADVAISAPSGNVTAAKAFQYFQSANSYTKAAYFRFISYDQTRQRLYLTNIDHVDVFDLVANSFTSPIYPPGGPPPDAGLRGLALTPDSSQLIVADFGAQSVYLLNPDTAAGTTVAVGGVAGVQNSGPALVAATSTQSVFVSLSAEGGPALCPTCLAQMNLSVTPPTVQPAPQPQVTSLTGAPLLHADAAGDHVFLAFGSTAAGPVALWNAAAPNQFTTLADNAVATELHTSSDGTMFSIVANGAPQVRASDLSVVSVPASPEIMQIPGRAYVPGIAVHPSGALIYQPFLTGASGAAGVKGGVDIIDAHSGALRLRFFLPQQFLTDVDGLHGSFLTVDENGQRLFAITSADGTPQNASVTILQLANVPLGIGSLSASSGPAAGGTSITLRGSGFQSGIKATLGGKSASVTFKDQNTLTLVTPALSTGAQQLVLTNPDGETVSLDAAFTTN